MDKLALLLAELPRADMDWAYFLDVDGTLIEMANQPDQVCVDAALLALVAHLHGACAGALALVSGRSVEDLHTLLGKVSVSMSGQHGLERIHASGQYREHQISMAWYDGWRLFLSELAASCPGAILEAKSSSLALHYRQIPQLAPKLHRSINARLRQFPELQLQAGKCVFEIKPARYNKGTAIAEFMAEAPFHARRPVFLGDDLTDEDGFVWVNQQGGYSIKVGPGKTHARYRLPNVLAVRAWLESALTVRDEAHDES